MKQIIINILFMVIGWVALSAQGFNWQISPRLPIAGSSLFIGGNVNYSIISDKGVFDFFEEDCNCGSFESGNGSKMKFGLVSEFWLQDGVTAIIGSLSYSISNTNFSAHSSLPIIIGDGLESEIYYKNTYESDLEYFNIAIGGKRRLFDSYLYISALLNFNVFLSNSDTHFEMITGPEWAPPFATNPPSYKRKISESSIQEIKRLSLSGSLCVGYDFDIGTGYYISPYVSFGFPVSNMIKKGKRKSTSYTFGLSLLRWI